MADQQPVQGSGADGTRPRRPRRWPPNRITPHPAETAGRTPRWVKGFGIAGVLLVLLVIVMLFSGHGPGRHMHSGLGGYRAPVDADGLGVFDGRRA